MDERPTLSPSGVGQFFRLQSCPMYLQWRYHEASEDLIEGREWEKDDLSPVLASEGDSFELTQVELLGADREVYTTESDELDTAEVDFTTLEDTPTALAEIAADVASRQPDENDVVVHQPVVQGTIGAYEVGGAGDLLLLEPTADGVRPTQFEVKSSSEQKVHHRYQASIYALLLEDLFRDHGIEHETDESGIASRIVTPENDLSGGPHEVEGFDTAPYRGKLQLKLEAGGAFDEVLLETEFAETKNRIAGRCSGCEYESMCMSRGFENLGLELLGLQAGTQETLEQLGIETIEDFANLYEHPEGGGHQLDMAPLEPRDPEFVRRVRMEADITNLQKQAQIAYRFLTEIDDEYGRDGPDYFAYGLQGTGRNLPQDAHQFDEVNWEQDPDHPDYPSESLVRVYLYVQEDFAQNRVTLLSARVENTETGISRTVTELPSKIPTNEGEKDAEEDRLFGAFFQRLTETIREVAPDLASSSAINRELADRVTENTGFLHLYLYADSHRRALLDAVRRHEESRWRRPLRTLLGLRSGIDQQMISILQDDFRKRWALRFPGLGTVQTVTNFNADGWFNWRTERTDGTMAELHEIFDEGLFDSVVEQFAISGLNRLDHSDRRLIWTPFDQALKGEYYPVRNRETTTIPVEYLWGVHDRLDPDAADDPELVDRFRYRNGGDRITGEDVGLLAEQFANATRHVERAIQQQGLTDRSVPKSPIEFDDLAELSFGRRSIVDACIEYQQLEFHTSKTSLEDYYTRPIEERIDSGSSVAFECVTVDEDEERIEGPLLASDLNRYDPESDSLIGGPLSVSEGDFMVLTPITEEGDRAEVLFNEDPTNIQRSPTVIVDSIDEETGRIALSAPFTNGWPNGEQYTADHYGWSTDESDAGPGGYTTYVGKGERYVVDPGVDKITQNRAYEALTHANDAPVYNWLQEFYDDERTELEIDRWDSESVEDYVDLVEDAQERPNDDQEALITDTDHGIVTLQGPPGTGKTKFTVAPAILGRVFADDRAGEQFVSFVSAVSHSAVNEALESVLDMQEACPAAESKEVDFVRVCSSTGQGIGDDRVREINYNGADADEFQDLYETYLEDDDDSPHVVFFSTPTSMRGLIKNMTYHVDMGGDGITDLYETGYESGAAELFDLVVIDEASMMDLPGSMLASAFLQQNGQLLLVGDHRQMQPIQQHEWESEDRETVERNVPFLSALEFLRFLRGNTESLEFLDSPPESPEVAEALPVHRLRTTYRLPEESAEMHTDLFYRKDDIELESASAGEWLPEADGPFASVLNSDDRIVLLVHDENESEKSNPVEQALVSELLSPLEITAGETDDEDEITAGVVVPFRAQRRELTDQLPGGAAIDTVERFQGGERDMMVLSMTASDRGYVSNTSEFLLDPKRFNVGASRMRRKLVVLASSAIFEESSNDVSTFEDQESWIEFLRGMGGFDDAGTRYTLDELVSDGVLAGFLEDPAVSAETSVRVLSGYGGRN